jgi:hypothetical protein
MEEIYFLETSVDTKRITRRYIPEDGTLHVSKRYFTFSYWTLGFNE